MIKETGLFEDVYYRAQARLHPTQDAVNHYLQQGWIAGLSPHRDFDGALLASYFESAGFSGPPLLTLAVLQMAGWPVYKNRDELDRFAEVMRLSPLFDVSYYRQQVGAALAGLDPVLHYLIVGEQLGFRPSAGFDPVYYAERYADVAGARLNCLYHFVANGQYENRCALSVADRQPIDLTRFSPAKRTVVVVSHDASRTGAPILAFNIAKQLAENYNVVVILMHGGALVGDFAAISSHLIVIKDGERTPTELKFFVKSILNARKVRFAVVNSIESRDIVQPFSRCFVPTLMLMHEFSSYTRPLESVRQALCWATKIVFSARLVLEAAVREHPNLADLDCQVIPQGLCDLTGLLPIKAKKDESKELKKAMRPEGHENDFVVLGAGSLHIRKGIDLFLMTAAEVLRRAPQLPVRFVWIGHGYEPDRDMSYSVYIREQILRSGLNDRVSLLDEVVGFENAYANADAFFLSSRLDPLPNVTIDASIHGLPVICFDQASGFAEILLRDPVAKLTVVPHLDVGAAASVIMELSSDAGLRQRLSEATRALGHATFDMRRYIGQLEDLGLSAIGAVSQRLQDFHTIRNDPLFDDTIFLPPSSRGESRDDAIKRFLAYWSSTLMAPSPLQILPDFRRPFPGFHPQLYAERNEPLTPGSNPLADFIRRGQPEGPWLHSVFRPIPGDNRLSGPTKLRVAIQAHFHYPELIVDFLAKLGANQHRCDLYLTTDTIAKAKFLETATAKYDRGCVVTRVVPNRGRDIGPFLTAFRQELVGGYDVIGHFHGKRSLSVDPAGGETWRDFLWHHLIGDLYPMMDFVLHRFEDDPGLGMVFAEEPHIVGWSKNRGLAEQLARKMNIALPLPQFHEFPVGTMFWARAEALAPMFSLDLGWEDYPEEPIDDDGTVLHALERLLPLAAGHANLSFATTYIQGVSR
ncbi:MAG TPA: rhamnan synthesis F family protein [Rhodopseudomonas sp.]|uniref:rhamnan synthesis F family protein n=1 Tax=Rhodopseudomonas sp. TaxID=1078 RepID=UPI002EDAE75D